MKFMERLPLLVTVAAACFVGIFASMAEKPQDDLVVGAYNPTGGVTYRLQTSVGYGDTTIRLSSFKNRSGIPLTMTNMNTDIAYATIEPQSTNSEFVSFTGVTQNSDGTAILTGVTRGLSDIYPFTASTTMQRAHPGQSVFILSDSPQLFNEYAAKRNDESITGTWTFASTSAPRYDDAYDATGNEFVSYQQLNSVVIAGAGTSTFDALGLVQLASQSQLAAGTASSSAGGPLVTPTKWFNATPSSCFSTACVPVAVAGKIAQGFLDLTQHFSFSSIFATNSSSTNATTTTALGWGTLSYRLPSSAPTATNNVLKAGATSPYQLTWSADTNTGAQYTYSDQTGVTADATTGTTSLMTIPASLITASSTIVVRGNASVSSNGSGASDCAIRLRTSTGTTIQSTSLATALASGNASGAFEILVLMNNSVSSQRNTAYGVYLSGVGGGGTMTGAGSYNSEGSSSVDFSGAVSIGINLLAGSNNSTCRLENWTMVITP